MIRKLLSLRRLFRLLPKLLAFLDHLETLWPKLERLHEVLARLDAIDSRITEMDVLHATAAVGRLESLDQSIKKIEKIVLSQPEPVAAKNGNGNDIKRLQLLSKFAHLSGKAREIELEWQRIQQNEHDALYAFHSSLNEEHKQDYYLKKGIVEGIKWCVERFS